MRKRRLKFYGHIMRLPEHRLTKRIVKYIDSLVNGGEWIRNVKKKKLGISQNHQRRNRRNKYYIFREKKLINFEVKPETKAPKTGGQIKRTRRMENEPSLLSVFHSGSFTTNNNNKQSFFYFF